MGLFYNYWTEPVIEVVLFNIRVTGGWGIDRYDGKDLLGDCLFQEEDLVRYMNHFR